MVESIALISGSDQTYHASYPIAAFFPNQFGQTFFHLFDLLTVDCPPGSVGAARYWSCLAIAA